MSLPRVSLWYWPLARLGSLQITSVAMKHLGRYNGVPNQWIGVKITSQLSKIHLSLFSLRAVEFSEFPAGEV